MGSPGRHRGECSSSVRGDVFRTGDLGGRGVIAGAGMPLCVAAPHGSASVQSAF